MTRPPDDEHRPGPCWPTGRPRVLVTDAWLANSGDAAIAVALDRLLRALAPGAAVLHAAYQHDTVGPLVPELRVVPPLEDLLGTPWHPPAPGWEVAGRELVAAADLVVCQGGGFLVEAYRPAGRIVALREVVDLGVPLAIVGVTLGRFDGTQARRDLRRVLRAARPLVVRDPDSVLHAADLHARARLGTDLALDLALDLARERASDAHAAAPRRGFAVVLTDHDPSPARRRARGDLATVTLAAVADALADVHADEPIDVWSTVQGFPDEAREDDAAVAAAAVAALPRRHADRVRLVTGWIPPTDAIERVRSARALVTLRLHPALFAAATATPFRVLLDGQRLGVLDTDGLRACVVPPDPEAVAPAMAAFAAELTTPTEVPPPDLLADHRARLDDLRAALAERLAALSTDGPDG